MARSTKEEQDALSMHTMDDEYVAPTPAYADLSAPLVDYSQEPTTRAKMETTAHVSPSQSSFYSSRPSTSTDWARGTSSEFSCDDAPLLGEEAPPPKYRYPLWGAFRSSTPPANERPVRVPFFKRIRVPSTWQTNDNACSNERCRRRFKGSMVALVLSAAFLLSAIVTFCAVSSIRVHRHRHYRPAPGWPHGCSNEYSRYSFYSFNDIRNLELVESPRQRFTGTLELLPSLPNQVDDLVMKTKLGTKPFSIWLNNHNVDASLNSPIPQPKTGTPPGSAFKRAAQFCGSSDVALHFREGLAIDNLALQVSSGTIRVQSTLNVTDTTTIRSPSAALVSTQFVNSRKTYIHSGSNSLQGHFKLYDVLSISSSSGSIDVSIDPQEVDPEHPKPAELMISSQNGRMKLGTTAVGTPPTREYITSIDSRNGMIQGTLLHGSKTIIRSTSGMVQLAILPHVFSNLSAASVLQVDTASGRQEINVHSLPSRGALTHMKSVHTSESGALQLRYPQGWEGRISGSTTSGSIDVRGSGVEVVTRGDHYVEAEKGDGDSALTFRALSGSAQLAF